MNERLGLLRTTVFLINGLEAGSIAKRDNVNVHRAAAKIVVSKGRAARGSVCNVLLSREAITKLGRPEHVYDVVVIAGRIKVPLLAKQLQETLSDGLCHHARFGREMPKPSVTAVTIKIVW